MCSVWKAAKKREPSEEAQRCKAWETIWLQGSTGQDIKVAEIKAGMKGKIKRLGLCEPNLSWLFGGNNRAVLSTWGAGFARWNGRCEDQFYVKLEVNNFTLAEEETGTNLEIELSSWS